MKSNSQNLNLEKAFSLLPTSCDWIGLRHLRETTSFRSYRNEKPEEAYSFLDEGIMVEVLIDGQFGSAGTSDWSDDGISAAAIRAIEMAKAAHKNKLYSFNQTVRPKAVGTYKSPGFRPFDTSALPEVIDTLKKATKALKVSDEIAQAEAVFRWVDTDINFISSNGSDFQQSFSLLSSDFSARAARGNETQKRSDKGGLAKCYQSGFEAFDQKEILENCRKIGFEAIELLNAENCPTMNCDLLLDSDHMLIQIHESIGHPLEIDRILGDERNYAGWSFIKPEDFGKLQYGSALMNITYDPNVPGEFASFMFDDGGAKAERAFLIKDGVLVRGLGGLESQTRSGLPGVSNFRSASWNRAPIDRMANINLEPGTTSIKKMIESTEKGIYVQSNVSWSIDDYRRKFQFGAEYGQLIENGKLTKVVKNPNYRGITVPFWQSLKYVGTPEENTMYGSPYCGKGEPSQVIRVGHASPPCLFSNIEVFGGEK